MEKITFFVLMGSAGPSKSSLISSANFCGLMNLFSLHDSARHNFSRAGNHPEIFSFFFKPNSLERTIFNFKTEGFGLETEQIVVLGDS